MLLPWMRARLSLKDLGYLIVMSTFTVVQTCVCLSIEGNVKLLPSQPKNNVAKKKLVTAKQAKISFINAKKIDREMTKGNRVILLTTWELPKESVTSIPFEITPVIDEFADVFPKDLLDQLPPLHDIQHAIDLVPRANLPNFHIIGWILMSKRSWRDELRIAKKALL